MNLVQLAILGLWFVTAVAFGLMFWWWLDSYIRSLTDEE